MNEEIRKNENVSFVPCGDAMEKMEELRDDTLGNVAGGVARPVKRDGVCTICGWNAYNRVIDGKNYLVCSNCGHRG